jgi:hypothetical protein
MNIIDLNERSEEEERSSWLGPPIESFLFDKTKLLEDKMWVYVFRADTTGLYYLQDERNPKTGAPVRRRLATGGTRVLPIPYDKQPAIIKIGYTKNPIERKKQLEKQSPFGIIVTHLFECGKLTSTGKSYYKAGTHKGCRYGYGYKRLWGYLALENMLHQLLDRYSANNEWFNVPPSVYKQLLKELSLLKPPTATRNIPVVTYVNNSKYYKGGKYDDISKIKNIKWVTKNYALNKVYYEPLKNSFFWMRYRYDD